MTQDFDIPPEKAAAILEQRARELAAAREPDVEEVAAEFLFFSLDGSTYGLETRYVQAVSRLRRLVPVPGSRPAFAGLSSLRGSFLAVLDLRVALGASRQSASRGDWLIAVGDREAQLGLIADGVDQIVGIHSTALLEHRKDPSPVPQTLIKGVTRDRGIVLDAANLIAYAAQAR